MECREPLFWNPPRPPATHSRSGTGSNSHAIGTGRYSRHKPHHNYHRYSPGNNATIPSHPVQEKKEEVALPLPKNVVLMEMIEAKERQTRLMIEANRKRQQELLEQRREKCLLRSKDQHRLSNQEEVEIEIGEGVGVGGYQQYKQLAVAPTKSLGTNLIGNGEIEDDDAYDDVEEVSLSLPLGNPSLNSGYAALSRTCGTYAVRELMGLVVLSHNPNRRHYQQKTKEQPYQVGIEEVDDKADEEMKDEGKSMVVSSSLLLHDDAQPRREPFTIEEGQKVQVVGVDEQGVYTLARGAGYIVATTNQLVKVGGPLETSCKLEGMLQSVVEKQEEVQKKLHEINNLAIGLQEKIILEQQRPEEVPVISQPKKCNENTVDGQPFVFSVNSDNNNNNDTNVYSGLQDGPYPSTPTKAFKVSHSNSPDGRNSGGESITSGDSTAVELGAPRTPCPPSYTSGPYIEMEQNSTVDGFNSDMSGHQQYVNSPAHSCPMPTNIAKLDQPLLDSTPVGPGRLRYRVNSDEDVRGMGWAGVLGCGSSLFGERLIEPSRKKTSSIFNTISNGHDILALSFEENSIMENSNSTESPLRNGESFDGINFRTGMSGHRGLGKPSNKPRRERQYTELTINNKPRRAVNMMSQHRGAATTRVQLQRRSTPDTLVGCQTIR